MAATTVLTVSTPAADAAVPTGFFRETVASGLNQPISVRFLPTGQAVVSEKQGFLQLIDPTSVPATPQMWLDLTGNINSGAEKGIIDFAIDPDFASNGKFYVYYSTGTPSNFRVSAFTDTGTPAGRLASEQVLWTDPTGYVTCCHYGGGLDVGPDGKLWLTVGDKFDGARAQDLTLTEGKVLRFNTDGTIPDGTDGWAANPYLAPGDGFPDEIWAYGLRNPFRARWDIPSGRFYIGEVGGNSNAAWEDLHVSGLDDAGTNYGWPNCEGLEPHTDFPDCDNTPHEDPLFAYAHSAVGGSASITAGEVYRAGIYPAEYDGAFFYGDYAREVVHYVTFDAQGNNPVDNVFDDAAGLVVGLSVGADGRLYSVSLTGDLYRYVFTGGPNQPPSVGGLTANPPVSPVGDPVAFSATLIDPDSGSLSYEWNFGDGTLVPGTGSPGPINQNHTYATTGGYNVTLMVDDGITQVTSDPIMVQVGTPPTATISTPADGSLFVGGEQINFSAPPPGAGETYSWDVLFTHESHTHPVISDQPGQSGSFTISDSGHDYTGNTGYRITLTVTDSVGLFGSTSVDIAPDKTDITIDAVPSGVTIDIDGVPRVTPLTLDTVKQFKHDLIAVPSRCVAGTIHDFVNWSNGQPATHTYTVPNSPETLVATYSDTAVACSATVPVTNGLAMRLTANEGVAASGGVVSSWQDQTSNANDVTPVGGSPTIVTDGLNGNDIIAFDGVDDALGRTGFTGLPTGNADRTVMMVVNYDSNGWGGFTYGRHSCDQAFGLGVSFNGALSVQGWCNDIQSAVNGPGTGWMSQTVTFEAGQGNLYRDGSLIESFANTYNTGTTELRIGSELDDSPHLDMDVAEILVYDRALNPSELAAVEAWIQATYLSGQPPAGPVVQLNSPTDGAIIIGTEVTADWDVPSGSQSGDQVAVSLDGGTPVLGALTGNHTFTGVAPGAHTVTATVTDSVGTPYTNPEASTTVNIVVQDSSPSLVPVTDGLVVDFGGGQNVVANGPDVTGWLDRSGNGNDVSLGGGSPSLGMVTPTGVAAVSFDGDDDKLERNGGLTGLPAGAADRTMFVVAQYNTGKWGGVVYGNNATAEAFGFGVNGPGKLYTNGWSYNANTPVAARGNGWFIHSAIVESNNLKQYNLLDEVGDSPRTYQTNPQRMVLGNDLGSNYVGMDIGAVLIYDRALTPAEHQLVATYLNETYLAGTGGPDITPPAITLTGAATMNVDQDSTWTEPGYTAIDNVDGDITASVTVGGDTVDTATVGTYLITYDVSDAAGNPATQVTRTVNVVGTGPDTTPPVITLTGAATVSLIQGGTWTEPGYSATDDIDGDITASVTVGGDTVDTATVGTYLITYDVSDAAGNPAAQVTRTVNVQPPGGPLPVTAGLVLNLDPANITSSGSAATGWNDASPNGNDLSIIAGNPTVGVSPTGTTTVSLGGGGDKLERSGPLVGLPSGSANRTMFVVGQYNAGKWGGVVYGNNLAREAFGFGVNGPGKLYTNGWSYNANTGVVARGNGWYVHSAILDSNTLTQYDLVSEIGQRTRNYQTNPQRLVLGNDLGVNYVDMDLAAVLIYDRALTSTEHQQVANYLNDTFLTGGSGPDTTPPAITLTGPSTMNVDEDSTWTEPGYIATDNVDGIITALVTVGGDTVDTATVGTYLITYDVSDAAGNPAPQVTRTVNVVGSGPDTTPPVITLTGAATMSVTQGATWSEPGYTATDDVDGDITASVTVGGDTVDTATVGTYLITYDVSDAAGNPAAQVTRTVNVQAGAGPLPVTAGLVLNLDAANITSSGGAATGWVDASPNGNDMTLAAGDPTVGVLTPTGAGSVSFDGSGDKLERNGGLVGFPSGPADRTMFVVAQYNTGKWGGVVYGNNASAEAFGSGVTGQGKLYTNGWAYNANTGVVARGNGWVAHSMIVESNSLTQYSLSTEIGSATRTYQTNPMRMVLGNDLGGNYVGMDVAAVLIYDRALTPAEHQQVTDYLNTTYLN